MTGAPVTPLGCGSHPEFLQDGVQFASSRKHHEISETVAAQEIGPIRKGNKAKPQPYSREPR